MQNSALLHAARSAVQKASSLCEYARAHLISSKFSEKEDRSPVTIADLACQISIIRDLQAITPDIPVVGEEDSVLLRDASSPWIAELRPLLAAHQLPEDTSTLQHLLDRGGFSGGPRGRYWALDPIDGTKGFLRGDQYAIALGLVENGQVLLGVLGCPRLPARGKTDGGSLFWAARGKGTYEAPLSGGLPQEASVQNISDPREATVCESVESGHTVHGTSARISERLGIHSPPYRMDSQCKYASVARGDATLYLRLPSRPGYREKIWDHAAGSIIVEEAGGRVSDTLGKALDFGQGRELTMNSGVVVTNGRVHDMVVDAVRAVLGT